MIDYKGIIEQLDTEKIKDLLDQMDIPYQEKESYLVMPTVCHNEDIDKASWKLYYYKNNHIFYCYTNCQSMSIFKFLKNYYETRNQDFDWYEGTQSGSQVNSLLTEVTKSLKTNNIENRTTDKKKSIIKKSEAKSVRKNADKKYNTTVNFKNNVSLTPIAPGNGIPETVVYNTACIENNWKKLNEFNPNDL